MTDTRPAKAPPVLPHPVGVPPDYYRSGPWWVALHAGAGAWVWQPGGSPVWVDGAADADEAVELVEAERRRPVGSPGRVSARGPIDGTAAARVRDSGLLGTLPDAEIAARLGVTRDVVRYTRAELGIARVPAQTRQELQRAHTDAQVREAWARGLRRDVDLARETGLSEAAVWAAKIRLGLRTEGRRRWTAEDLEQVAAFPTVEAAATAMGLTVGQVRAARKRSRPK